MAEFKDLLIEIGTEELPPTALRSLRDAFARGVSAGLEEAGIGFDNMRSFASPRRLAVQVTRLADRQPDQTVERKGPAVAAAFDTDGNPTKAAEGFARSCGVAVADLATESTKKGEWLMYRGTQEGADTVALLPDIVQAALDALPIPKRMRWGAGSATFVRPVHWSVALYGEDVVPMTLLETRTGRDTRGHRFHAPDVIELANAGEYAHRLEQDGWVIADLDARRTRIEEQARAAAKDLGGDILADDGLLDEVAALVEWPVVMVGGFDDRFLDVPAEALISSMQGHQKYFPVTDNTGRLLPRFVMVANLESRDPGEVVRGNERVIRPRLADAEFFWQQDRRRSLADRVDDLHNIVFQDKLGTLHDKQRRVAALARTIAPAFGADPDLAERAAMIGKCDLVTEMVDEFPELQGTMGRYYATHDGEDPAVAAAMEEQYQPRFAGDVTPAGAIGQVLAVADRADTLAGIFAIGQGPTGDKDPFALRRAGLGLVRILIERERPLSLHELLTRAAAQLPAGLQGEKQVETVRSFCLERLKRYYQEQGIGAELFDAVDALGIDDPVDFHRRLQACAEFLKLDEADSLAAANKRVRNILRKLDGAPPEAVDNQLLQMAEEQQLAEVLEPLIVEVDDLSSRGDYRSALQRLATVRDPVDAFFDGVMVMAEDDAVRRNRLALLARLNALFGRVADLSRLPAG
ncbi:glycine--tRNA ligase subunit beta [Aquisalimonas asiatica]|uniref:Glycine--tRNA ligase beta subunit n=1 Tax=Aquisalimonas asiatica TaxID=406100 RepID=A0A1H8UC13_9GAMM|nr:glycine--tRNA ligase subunit beta [Aquisalimonas asiatica]SEP00636.1 glycyl-tRNA synthetase beta chain [Aquisalimonas asiatica]